MSKVLFLKGLPASGKSTYAHQLIKKHPEDWVRVNKDDLRSMLHEGVYRKSTEGMIMSLEFAMADHALTKGKNVIVDDTNLNPKHETRFRALADTHGSDFEVKLFDVPVSVALLRDEQRAQSVGAKVIKQMYEEYLKPPRPEPPEFIDGLPNAIIVDIDGTLAERGDRDWFQWERVHTDYVKHVVADLVRDYKNMGYEIIIVTGRDGVCEEVTKKWLDTHSIPFDYFYMRPEGNNEQDSIIKKRIYEDHIRGKFNVKFVVDDRKQVVDMWRNELGFTVFQCEEGDF